MKIISKYKDFYDFLCQDNDADLHYVRTPFFVTNDYTHMYRQTFEHQGFHVSRNFERWYSPKSVGSIFMSAIIYGIYPYVYSQPYLCLNVEDSVGNTNGLIEVVSKSWCDDYSSLSDDNSRKAMLKSKSADILSHHPNSKEPRNYRFHQFSMNRLLWKYECPEIFKRIGAPVFIEANDKILGNIYNTSMDFKRIGDGKYIKYVANICFNKLGENVLKCWFDELNDINTYINIENFLWSIKQEPENDPDDKTKIISHGFDLKTSFRKI